MPTDSNRLLTQLEAMRGRFDPSAAKLAAKILARLAKLRLNRHQAIIRLHENLLLLRAFPRNSSQVDMVERLLKTFRWRIDQLRGANADISVFDDFDTSGIAGTTMQDVLSFDVARWLVRSFPKSAEIAWDDYWEDYQSERSRGSIWPRFIPLLEEDAEVEANIPWVRWLNEALGRRDALPWLLNRFEALPLPARQQAELYDALRIPVRWKLENPKLSRTCYWSRPRKFFFHDIPLIRRNEVSLSHELGRPTPQLKKLTASAGAAAIQALREIMVVRYRELYGGTFGDPRNVYRADLGRGVVMHFWGLQPERRLPLRAYLAGFTLKNGVPINYIEAIGLCEWMEIGFNTFYTYRQGETAWLYAQALRCLRALSGVTCISIYPYQIGKDNDEAIDSGAFWFYRKLGFRPGRADLLALCEREEKKIAANPGYRTPPRTLKQFAEENMFYELQSKIGKPGDWDRFSVRNLGLGINRRMGRDFDGDSVKMRQASVLQADRALRINAAGWTADQKRSLENWSLVLASISDLGRWPLGEKRELVRIIRSKAAPNEMNYLRQTQRHARLRAELLSMGS